MEQAPEDDVLSKKYINSNTIILFVAFVIIFSLLGAFIGYVIGLIFHDFKWYHMMLIMFAIAIVAIVVQYYSVRDKVNQAEELSRQQDGQFTELKAMVSDLASKAGISTPSLIVESNEEPNAYTLGFDDKSFIVVHDSLLQSLKRNEIEGVLAHEISHVKDGDCFTKILTTRLSNVTAAFSKYLGLGLIIAGIGMMGVGGAASSGKNNSNAGLLILILLVVGIVLIVIGGILCIFYPPAALLKMGIGREREYDADRSAAYLTKKPRALANALQKLENYSIPDKELDDKFADSMIVSHFSRKSVFNRMMDTHPPTEERVNRLLKIEQEMRDKGIDTHLYRV